MKIIQYPYECEAHQASNWLCDFQYFNFVDPTIVFADGSNHIMHYDENEISGSSIFICKCRDGLVAKDDV